MKSQTESLTLPAERRIVILVHSALAGTSIAASLELASRETLTPLLLVALGCFAITIPAAIALVILSQVISEVAKAFDASETLESQSWPLLSYVLAVADQIGCYLGFLLIFWHFHWIIGMIFLIATGFALVTTWMAGNALRKMEKALAETKRYETLSPPL
jgi:hypothetical protein